MTTVLATDEYNEGSRRRHQLAINDGLFWRLKQMAVDKNKTWLDIAEEACIQYVHREKTALFSTFKGKKIKIE
ncbi:MAG: hypothetical protein WAM14_08320 [Candidatus Nitrosopolaris sp.]